MDRFGALGGTYYYDKYKKEAEGSSSDDFDFPVNGTKNGKKIHIEVTCFYCQDVSNPEVFEGTFLGDTAISGTWIEKHGKRKRLPFYLKCVSSSKSMKHRSVLSFFRKDLWSSDFFDQSYIQKGLEDALGPHLDDFMKFLQMPMARTDFDTSNGMLSVQLWREHEGPGNECEIDVNPQTKDSYIFWQNDYDTVVKCYGNPPLALLQSFCDGLNAQWGGFDSWGSNKFILSGNEILMVPKNGTNAKKL